MSRPRPISSSHSTPPMHETSEVSWKVRNPGEGRSTAEDGAVEYVVEERRRTYYVKSTLPPDQWDKETLQSIMASPDERGSAPAATFRRTQSCTLSGTKIEEMEEETDTPSLPKNNSDSPSQAPTPTMPLFPRTNRPESYPGTPTKLRKSPPPPPPINPRGDQDGHPRRKIYFYHKNDPHYGFTNFSDHPVRYKGREYPTSEHLFQSFKVNTLILDQPTIVLTY